jgi:hypothetical protein
MQQKRDELVAQAQPAAGLFDNVEPEAVSTGAELNRRNKGSENGDRGTRADPRSLLPDPA